MVKTIINGVLYDYIQPPITLGGGEHDHEAGEVDLTDIESRITANENQLANATPDNTAGVLVQRAEVTNFTDLVARNADVNEVVELLQSSGISTGRTPRATNSSRSEVLCWRKTQAQS